MPTPRTSGDGDDIIQQLKDNVDGPMAERFRKAREDGETWHQAGCRGATSLPSKAEIDTCKHNTSADICRVSLAAFHEVVCFQKFCFV